MKARGEMLLMADADGATKFHDFALMEKQLLHDRVNGFAAAIGSRAHMQEEQKANVRRARPFRPVFYAYTRTAYRSAIDLDARIPCLCRCALRRTRDSRHSVRVQALHQVCKALLTQPVAKLATTKPAIIC